MSSPKELEAAASDHQEVNGLSEKVIEHVGEGDEHTNLYVTGPAVEIDPATNKRLFWKINRRILVIQLITYFCQSLDKGTLNFASIMGIKDDAKLVGQEVSARPACLSRTHANVSL
jgi:hypothetical protein